VLQDLKAFKDLVVQLVLPALLAQPVLLVQLLSFLVLLAQPVLLGLLVQLDFKVKSVLPVLLE
jgi:uncharacterized membrane protein